MGMDTYVVGYTGVQEKVFKEMKAVFDACAKACVPLPKEVDEYFNGEEPDELGIEKDLGDAVQEYSVDMRDGFQVELAKIPKNITHIRFINSY